MLVIAVYVCSSALHMLDFLLFYGKFNLCPVFFCFMLVRSVIFSDMQLLDVLSVIAV